MFNNAKTRLAGSVALCLAAGLPISAHATEGYFSLGYGVAQSGVAGAGVAYSQDAMSSSINPAAVATVGRELTFGVQVFSPKRSYDASGTLFVAPGKVESGRDYFLIPNFAYNMPLDNGGVLNIAAYGNGGMNTSYPNLTNTSYMCSMYGGQGVFCDGDAGVDLMQLFVSVGYAKKDGALSWGIAPTLAVQTFAAKGISTFGDFDMSSDLDHLSDNGHDYSTGFGLRAGLQYEVNPQFSLGISGQTKFKMSKFDDYAGLFENGGEFDIPASITVGAAFHPRPDLTLMLDLQRIYYSDVPAVGNPTSVDGKQLGDKGGPGFGWDDVDVIRIGAEWQQSPDMTWRVGYAHSTNPVGPEDVMFNILAPGIVKDHFSFGGSKKISDNDQFDFAINYVASNKVSGMEMIPGSSIELEMHQVIAAVGWTHRF